MSKTSTMRSSQSTGSFPRSPDSHPVSNGDFIPGSSPITTGQSGNSSGSSTLSRGYRSQSVATPLTKDKITRFASPNRYDLLDAPTSFLDSRKSRSRSSARRTNDALQWRVPAHTPPDGMIKSRLPQAYQTSGSAVMPPLRVSTTTSLPTRKVRQCGSADLDKNGDKTKHIDSKLNQWSQPCIVDRMAMIENRMNALKSERLREKRQYDQDLLRMSVSNHTGPDECSSRLHSDRSRPFPFKVFDINIDSQLEDGKDKEVTKPPGYLMPSPRSPAADWDFLVRPPKSFPVSDLETLDNGRQDPLVYSSLFSSFSSGIPPEVGVSDKLSDSDVHAFFSPAQQSHLATPVASITQLYPTPQTTPGHNPPVDSSTPQPSEATSKTRLVIHSDTSAHAKILTYKPSRSDTLDSRADPTLTRHLDKLASQMGLLGNSASTSPTTSLAIDDRPSSTDLNRTKTSSSPSSTMKISPPPGDKPPVSLLRKSSSRISSFLRRLSPRIKRRSKSFSPARPAVEGDQSTTPADNSCHGDQIQSRLTPSSSTYSAASGDIKGEDKGRSGNALVRLFSKRGRRSRTGSAKSNGKDAKKKVLAKGEFVSTPGSYEGYPLSPGTSSTLPPSSKLCHEVVEISGDHSRQPSTTSGNSSMAQSTTASDSRRLMQALERDRVTDPYAKFKSRQHQQVSNGALMTPSSTAPALAPSNLHQLPSPPPTPGRIVGPSHTLSSDQCKVFGAASLDHHLDKPCDPVDETPPGYLNLALSAFGYSSYRRSNTPEPHPSSAKSTELAYISPQHIGNGDNQFSPGQATFKTSSEFLGLTGGDDSLASKDLPDSISNQLDSMVDSDSWKTADQENNNSSALREEAGNIKENGHHTTEDNNNTVNSDALTLNLSCLNQSDSSPASPNNSSHQFSSVFHSQCGHSSKESDLLLRRKKLLLKTRSTCEDKEARQRSSLIMLAVAQASPRSKLPIGSHQHLGSTEGVAWDPSGSPDAHGGDMSWQESSFSSSANGRLRNGHSPVDKQPPNTLGRSFTLPDDFPCPQQSAGSLPSSPLQPTIEDSSSPLHQPVKNGCSTPQTNHDAAGLSLDQSGGDVSSEIANNNTSLLVSINGDASLTDDRPSGSTKDGHYYLMEVDRTEVGIRIQIQTSESDLNTHGDLMSEEVSGILRTAVGKANLLLTEKFAQFRGLCEQNLSSLNGNSSLPGAAEYVTLTSDLEGFWEMVLLQVDDITRMFSEIDEIRQNGWKIVKRPTKPSLPMTSSRTAKCAVSSHPSSAKSIRSNQSDSSSKNTARLEARKRLLAAKREAMAKMKEQDSSASTTEFNSDIVIYT